jgi:hypothetical protein
VLAAHEDASHRTVIADLLRAAAALDLGGRAIGEIVAMPLARVDHQHAHRAGGIEHALARGDHRLQRRDVVAERFAETAGQHEVALHVDDDERGRRRIEIEFVRLGLHRAVGHGAHLATDRSERLLHHETGPRFTPATRAPSGAVVPPQYRAGSRATVVHDVGHVHEGDSYALLCCRAR